MLKRLLFGLCLLLLVLPSTSSLEITKKQMTELQGILTTYTSLTSELKLTLIQQKATLKNQQQIIQKLSISFLDLKTTTKDLESSFLKYKKAQRVKDILLYTTGSILLIGLIWGIVN